MCSRARALLAEADGVGGQAEPGVERRPRRTPPRAPRPAASSVRATAWLPSWRCTLAAVEAASAANNRRSADSDCVVVSGSRTVSALPYRPEAPKRDAEQPRGRGGLRAAPGHPGDLDGLLERRDAGHGAAVEGGALARGKQPRELALDRLHALAFLGRVLAHQATVATPWAGYRQRTSSISVREGCRPLAHSALARGRADEQRDRLDEVRRAAYARRQRRTPAWAARHDHRRRSQARQSAEQRRDRRWRRSVTTRRRRPGRSGGPPPRAHRAAPGRRASWLGTRRSASAAASACSGRTCCSSSAAVSRIGRASTGCAQAPPVPASAVITLIETRCSTSTPRPSGQRLVADPDERRARAAGPRSRRPHAARSSRATVRVIAPESSAAAAARAGRVRRAGARSRAAPSTGAACSSTVAGAAAAPRGQASSRAARAASEGPTPLGMSRCMASAGRRPSRVVATVGAGRVARRPEAVAPVPGAQAWPGADDRARRGDRARP